MSRKSYSYVSLSHSLTPSSFPPDASPTHLPTNQRTKQAPSSPSWSGRWRGWSASLPSSTTLPKRARNTPQTGTASSTRKHSDRHSAQCAFDPAYIRSACASSAVPEPCRNAVWRERESGAGRTRFVAGLGEGLFLGLIAGPGVGGGGPGGRGALTSLNEETL